MRPEISVVIPVFNERDNLPFLIDELSKELIAVGLSFEVICVDDRSTDGSSEVLGDLSRTRAWLAVISLARNYGQSTALQAGFDKACGEFIVTLDADLQNDPSDIPKLINILRDRPQIDCVSGWRKNRKDALISRKIPSLFANLLISKLTGVQLKDYGCALKAYRIAIIKNVRLYGELHRFIPALAQESGATILEVPVNHRPRKAGKSKYGISRTFRVLLDLVWIKFTLKFLHRPIQVFGGFGFLMFTFGLAIFIFLLYEKLGGAEIGGRPLLMMGVLLTLGGLQFLAVGILGELLIRIYHEPRGRKQYLTRELD